MQTSNIIVNEIERLDKHDHNIMRKVRGHNIANISEREREREDGGKKEERRKGKKKRGDREERGKKREKGRKEKRKEKKERKQKNF